MGKLIELHLCNSIQELQKKSELGNLNDLKTKAICESAKKVIEKANSEYIRGDEEGAYILFFKYFSIIKIVRQRKEYKDDEKYFDSLYNIKKEARLALERMGMLSSSLEKRYLEKQAKLQQQKLRLAENNNVVPKNQVPKDGSNRQAGQELTNGNHDAMSTPSRKPGTRINKDVEQEKENESPEERLLDVRELNALITQKSQTFLILDTRPAEHYKASHIKHVYSLNVPEDILIAGSTADRIGKQIPLEHRNQWPRRSTVDKLIICDWKSSGFGEANTPISILKTAMSKWDPGTKYNNWPPYLLKDGYEMFRLAYPHSVTDPKFAAKDVLSNNTGNDSNSFNNLTNLDSILYPDLNKGFITTPRESLTTTPSESFAATPSPKPANFSSAIQTNRGPGVVQYPVLENINDNLNFAGKTSTPHIDRSRKPSMANKPQSSDHSVGLNTAKDQFSTISAVSDMTSVNNTSTNNNLNNGLIDSMASIDINGTTDSSKNSNDSHYSTINRHNVGMTESGLSASKNHIPKVDRSKKEEALARHEEKLRRLKAVSNSNDIQAVDAARRDLENLSIEREREMDTAAKEKDWLIHRLKREAEANEDMQFFYRDQMDRAETEMSELKRQNDERIANEQKLLEQLEVLSKQLKEQERKKKMDAEKAAREKEVERLRKEKRDNEAAVRRRAEQDEAAARRTPNQNEVRKERLKEDSDSSRKEGGLSRSYSSPNLCQLLDDKNRDLRKNVPAPKFDREQKPISVVKRDFAGKWGIVKPGLTGLRNLGNTCYMNSIIQCISNTSPLVDYFLTGRYDEDLNREHSETKGQVAIEFAALLRSIWSNQYKSISPSDFKYCVGRFKNEFAGREQQDSHEFLSKLLEWLHNDTNRVKKPKKTREIDCKGLKDGEAARKQWLSFLEGNQSIIVQLFCGQTRQSVRCQNCGAVSLKYQEFNNLTLPIPSNSSGKVTLYDCFDLYLREDKVDWTCEECKSKSTAVRKMDIVKLPPLLIIQLERFYPDSQMIRCGEIKYRKKQNFVSFDANNLPLGNFTLNGRGLDNRYNSFNVYAVSNHFGSLEGGHYTACCHNYGERSWYKYDDQDVATIDFRDVVTPAAYILFLTALDGKNSLHPLG